MSRARVIPAVDHLLGLPAMRALGAVHGRQRVRHVLDAEIVALRDALVHGTTGPASREDATAVLVQRVEARLADDLPSLRAVVNATGVIIHTNLGRAPLSDDALAEATAVARYSTLEFDLATGQRGSRHVHLEAALREATGAETGVATNNTAAGLTLTLAALAAGREVIISRGELVEIGGGFRVPEILRASGALLREVGTTNRTRVADYAAAISDRTAAILRVHPSNFRMDGFTERPRLPDLAALAHRFQIPLIDDQGSGWLGLDLFEPQDFPVDARAILGQEPSVRASVRDGADVVAFSGDKLLGGPQAGVLVGRAEPIGRIRAHPLMRAVRVDKLTSAALQATLTAFTSGRAIERVPVMRMIAAPLDDLTRRADALATRLRAAGVPCTVRDGASTVGGGSLPGTTLPTRLVALEGTAPDSLLAALRQGRPPVIARIVDDQVCLDVRTIAAHEEEIVVAAVGEAGRTGEERRGSHFFP